MDWTTGALAFTALALAAVGMLLCRAPLLRPAVDRRRLRRGGRNGISRALDRSCLLYTSDAADDM
eukprot:1114342-Alexandrium_andersonii.AAC.1